MTETPATSTAYFENIKTVEGLGNKLYHHMSKSDLEFIYIAECKRRTDTRIRMLLGTIVAGGIISTIAFCNMASEITSLRTAVDNLKNPHKNENNISTLKP